MIVLGIETTCDETAAAIVKNGNEILSNIVSSQVPIHEEYGGVFPELACRSHLDMILPVIEKSMKIASIKKDRKTIRIGSYRSEDEASKAYNEMAVKIFGEFAYANTPT